MTPPRRSRPDLLLSPDGRERRAAQLTDVEVRSADLAEGEPIPFRGIASTFMDPYSIGDPARWGFWEQMAPTAFDEVLNDDRTAMLKNHNADLPLARVGAGNLDLSAPSEGLLTVARMTPTTYALDLALALEVGDVYQMSFAFNIADEKWVILQEDTDWGGKAGQELVTVTVVSRLWEVSPVTFPANENTDAALANSSLRRLRSALDITDDDLLRLHRSLETDQRSNELHDLLDAVAKRLEDPADPTPGDGTGTPAGEADPDPRATPSPVARHLALATAMTEGSI
jgi:HK97 family phage prohead protease